MKTFSEINDHCAILGDLLVTIANKVAEMTFNVFLRRVRIKDPSVRH